ncbi:MAG TPA: GAF domain-containing protein [Gaiellaceae bacterium]|nr:GAF domain-containing protein [Gaiellaceae bacterium]
MPSSASVETSRAYLAAALDCVVMADAAGRVVEFNPAAERTFGYTRAEALGRTLAELIVPPSLRDRHSQAFSQFIATGTQRMFGRRLELTGMRADGSEFPVELALSCVESDPLLVCGALRDLTAVKRAEGDLRTLAAEQAALRRVATLVADEAASDAIFASVAEEIARILMADRCAIGRFEADESMTVVAYWSNEDPKVPVDTRIGLQGDGVTAAVRESRRPILIDDHEAFSGPLMDYARSLGSLPRSTVAAPIFVESRVWGMIFASTMAVEIAEGSESRVVDFAELVATAIANTEARRELERVVAEQQALRTTATLVASGAPPTEVFAAITTSASELFEVPFASLLRYGPDETATMVAGCAACSGFVGQAWTVPVDDPGIVRTVVASRRPARIEDHSGVQGPLGEAAQSLGIGSVVGVPVIVDGSVWGVLAVGAAEDGPPLPLDASDRLVGFTELVTTTLINAEAREEVRSLLNEQATLRRVATLIAQGARADAVFVAVCDEAVQLLDAEQAAVVRLEVDEPALVTVGLSAGLEGATIGVRSALGDWPTSSAACRTGRTARSDVSAEEITGTGLIADMVRTKGFLSTVSAPILLEGRVWGVMTVSNSRRALARDTERRIENFTELIATAIANAESRAGLAASEARARELANEQAALRRVATLVAQGATPDELFSAVAEEVAGIIDIPVVGVHRYEADGTFTMLGIAGETHFTVGSRWPVDDEGIAGMILASGGPARRDDYSTMPGQLGDALRKDEMVSTVGVPIVVDGSIWGFMVAAAKPGRPIPSDIEKRLIRFTELVATAVSNATTRTDLLTSRARVVSAADETRRRLERDLHDGIQQWLVGLALRARKAAGLSAAGESPVQELSGLADDLVAVTDELREISRGIHPAILSDAGLDDALAALARRCAIHTKLDVSFQGRFDPTLEATVYYVVAESITNAVKHAQASTVAVRGGLRGDAIELEISDDGVGGADPRRGTGLIGLKDRVDTLGGTISFASPAAAGTTIRVRLPTSPRPGENLPLPPDEAASTPASG